MKKVLLLLTLGLWLALEGGAQAAMRVDIYGPGQNIVNLALAAPIKGPQTQASGMGTELQKIVEQNLSFLPFMRLTDPRAVLGGVLLAGYEPPSLDFKRFQLAGSDIVVTTFWPEGDSGTRPVQIRAFETNTGGRLFGKEYPNVWLVKPSGRDLRQITNLAGESMSPAWSPDGRFIVFTHIDQKSHALGVWDRSTGKVQRIRFPGNVVIGPAFMPDNKVAVALSNGKYPVIFQLNHVFQKERVLEQGNSINVSPTFDKTGTKMAFTSSRLGGPQNFLKELSSGSTTRVSMNGTNNTEANLSPDGTLVVYSRMTDFGHRIFVQDMLTGMERQITFGPGSDEQPSFCADSYFIAFASTRGGGRGIYLTTRHGGDAKRVPTGGGPASFPRWGMPGAAK